MISINILTIFTGGTIGSIHKEGKVTLDQNKYKLIEKAKEKYDLNDVEFDIKEPYFVLSENMLIDHWNQLIMLLRQTDFKQYKGIIITHGTDTLAYTANLLAMLLGNIGIPVVLVSSGSDLESEMENGTDNFYSALKLIRAGIPGVFVPFRQCGKDIIHLGSRIMQSRHFTDDFISLMDSPYAQIKGGIIEYNPSPYNIEETELKYGSSLLLQHPLFQISKRVLVQFPYIGQVFDYICLDGFSAVLLGTYHSGTFCMESNSFQRFYQECQRRSIPVFLAPISQRHSNRPYESTDQAITAGIVPIVNVTLEAAYTKLLILSQIYDGNTLKENINTDLFYEKIAE